MSPGQSRLRMRHTESGFWKFAGAYILLGSGTGIILLTILLWALFGEKLALISGLISVAVALFALSGLKRTYGGDSSSKGAKDLDQLHR